jgi:hypothetical protein
MVAKTISTEEQTISDEVKKISDKTHSIAAQVAKAIGTDKESIAAKVFRQIKEGKGHRILAKGVQAAKDNSFNAHPWAGATITELTPKEKKDLDKKLADMKKEQSNW